MEKTIKIGTKIAIHGFVMLKGLKHGKYVVSNVDSISYSFRRINGSKDVCRHYKLSVEGMVKNLDSGSYNGIEILN